MKPTECKHTLTIDFETYYDQQYSLKKLTTQEYILSPYFEVICVAVKLDDGDTQSFTGTMAETRAWLEQFPWDDACLVAHNAMFDAAILLWHFQIVPAAFFCTMQGARPHIVPYVPGGRMSLDATTKHLGIGQKGDALIKTMGLYREQILVDGKMLGLLAYCVKDTDLCYELYKMEKAGLTSDEQFMLSLTIRKFVIPQVYLDRDTLADELAQTKRDKAEVLQKVCHAIGTFEPEQVKRRLMSNNLFADFLREYGCEPPTKTSVRTGKDTYAFAKTDLGFQELLEHPDPMIQSLATARLGTKSTQKETRLERFLSVRNTTRSGVFAIPLLYYGAHTGRFSGMDSLNLQNLPRGDALRMCLKPKPGHKFVVADLSQVEARITAALCGQRNLMESFARGEDVYSVFASDLYGRPITKANKEERFIGKQCILGLGFSMSWKKFHDTMKTFGIEMSEKEAKRIVYFYRGQYNSIPAGWSVLERAIDCMITGDIFQWGPVTFMKGRCVLPNGMQLHYPDLHYNYVDSKGSTWQGASYNYRGKRKKIYGGALLENIVQALARIILVRAELALAERGVYAALSVHDELIYSAKDEHAEIINLAVNRALTAPVEWLPGLALASESDIGASYGDAK